ncbi:hypothetical protein TNCV_188611 [Trichonephila clavipes]|nr:hypothetical protein TNCV_188611 [Trichonephila clavipes]
MKSHRVVGADACYICRGSNVLSLVWCRSKENGCHFECRLDHGSKLRGPLPVFRVLPYNVISIHTHSFIPVCCWLQLEGERIAARSKIHGYFE